MAIFVNNKEVTDIYIGKVRVNAVYKDFKEIYSSFSKIWKDKNIWKDNAVWKS